MDHLFLYRFLLWTLQEIWCLIMCHNRSKTSHQKRFILLFWDKWPVSTFRETLEAFPSKLKPIKRVPIASCKKLNWPWFREGLKKEKKKEWELPKLWPLGAFCFILYTLLVGFIFPTTKAFNYQSRSLCKKFHFFFSK